MIKAFLIPAFALALLWVLGCGAQRAQLSDCEVTNEKPDNVSVHYDRFRNLTTVTLDDLQFGARIPVPGARAICLAQVRIELSTWFLGRATIPDHPLTIHMLVGGLVVRGSGIWDAVFLLDRSTSIVIRLNPSDASGNSFVGSFARDTLAAIVKAGVVEISVAGLEAELTDLQKSLLREFLANLDP